ncbi:MAG: ferrous iron transport protein B, partial [Anaerolineaceae bacterium]
PRLLKAIKKNISHLETLFGEDVDTLVADRRYGWINGLVRETTHAENAGKRLLSDRIDDIVTNRLLGIPIFLLSMWLVFKITTDLSAPLLDWVTAVLEGPLTRWSGALISVLGLTGTWVDSLLLDGVIAGVGGLMAFVPVLMALYGALAILEDSGYMARAAFVMDRFMHVLGLHGKSFLPLIVGFGCSVPGIFATRTLENKKDRILTAMMVPFMSCGARLPVYVLISGIFFAEKAGLMVFWMYFIGIAMAILTGLLLKNTLFRGKTESPFVLELPPYRVPTLKAIWFHMWEHTSAFIKKAGSLILLMSLVIWLLLAIPVNGTGRFADVDLQSSAYAAVSRVLAPTLRPAGFGSWQTSGALISGIAAKEVIVTSLTQVYGMETPGQQTVQTNFV